MDEYKHCMNCIITRAELVKANLALFGKDEADRHYRKILGWFKQTYELKRKPSQKRG